MARQPLATGANSPGRFLAILALVLVALGTWVGVTGHDKPKLGLDLQGGTSVTLIPQIANNGQGKITNASINQAIDIIRQRVNGSGVAEAEVTRQGSGSNATIVVSVPGKNQGDLVDKVGQTAQLSFRPVLQEGNAGVPVTPSPSSGVSGSPAPTGSATPSVAVSSAPSSPSATPSASLSGSSAGRALSRVLLDASASPSSSSSTSAASTSPSATPTSSSTASPTVSATGTPSPGPAVDPATLQGPTAASLAQVYATIDCTNPANSQGFKDDPTKLLVTCSRDGFTKFLLDKTAVAGTEVKSAQATLDLQNGSGWLISLQFKGKGTNQFKDITAKLVNNPSPTNEFAITLDGLVVSHPYVQSAIVDGNAQINGSFTKKEAQDLADVLKYGALPLSFQTGEVETVSPTLGSNQLDAGLIAGALGLFLVVLYSILYYRGLAFVTVLSLAVAGALTYFLICYLGQVLSFTLTLAGVAGTIVAIGITADSFVVFFERLRDEVREGRSLRAAVESGWIRARRTIIAADLVSILASAVLYVVSIGAVRGFAFTLGLTTFVDLFVVFFFTKPVMTLLARTEFFGKGHKWSGLDPDRLGRRTPTTTVKEA